MTDITLINQNRDTSEQTTYSVTGPLSEVVLYLWQVLPDDAEELTFLLTEGRYEEVADRLETLHNFQMIWSGSEEE